MKNITFLSLLIIFLATTIHGSENLSDPILSEQGSGIQLTSENLRDQNNQIPVRSRTNSDSSASTNRADYNPLTASHRVATARAINQASIVAINIVGDPENDLIEVDINHEDDRPDNVSNHRQARVEQNLPIIQQVLPELSSCSVLSQTAQSFKEDAKNICCKCDYSCCFVQIVATSRDAPNIFCPGPDHLPEQVKECRNNCTACSSCIFCCPCYFVCQD